jgi:hypothetical protein
MGEPAAHLFLKNWKLIDEGMKLGSSGGLNETRESGIDIPRLPGTIARNMMFRKVRTDRSIR